MLKLAKYLKPYKWMVLLVLVLTFVQCLCELFLPNIMSEIVDIGIKNQDVPYIINRGAFMIAVSLVSIICTLASALFASKSAMGLGRDLRELIFTRVEEYSLSEFDKFGTSSLITRTINDVTQVQTVWMMLLRMLLLTPLMCIGGIVMALGKDVRMSVVFIGFLPIIVLIVLFFMRVTMPLFSKMQKKMDKLNMVSRENLTGVRVIRAFNRDEHENERFIESSIDLTQTGLRVFRLMAALFPLFFLIVNLCAITITWVGARYIGQGTMEIGTLMAFMQYTWLIMMSLIMFSMIFMIFPRGQVSAERINEVLSSFASIKDSGENGECGVTKGYLSFKNVSFTYPGAEERALEGVSFDAKPNEITAIIGSTGSGKSTLINLILRFYDVDEAENSGIFVDGIDIRNIPLSLLRKKIGYISQKAAVFSGSIRDNLLMGKEDATEDELWAALKTARLDSFVADLEKGPDSELMQGGANLSGGQKQRISIARALIRKPEIYIFDDSFSALDYKTDAELRAELKKEIGASTVLIVAQRVSTVMNADRIIVMSEGKAVDIGTHKELYERNGVYREIVASQLSEEEL